MTPAFDARAVAPFPSPLHATALTNSN